LSPPVSDSILKPVSDSILKPVSVCMCKYCGLFEFGLATMVTCPLPLNVSAKTFTLYSHILNNVLYAKLQTAQYLKRDYKQFVNRKICMYSLLGSWFLAPERRMTRRTYAVSRPTIEAAIYDRSPGIVNTHTHTHTHTQ